MQNRSYGAGASASSSADESASPSLVIALGIGTGGMAVAASRGPSVDRHDATLYFPRDEQRLPDAQHEHERLVRWLGRPPGVRCFAASCLITLVTLQATSMPASVASGTLTCALPGLPVAQGDFVGLGDVVGLDGPQSQAQAFASLPQQLEGVGGGALRGGALRISPVFLDEVGLQGCGDFIGRLQRVVDGPVPCCVVNHVASIARQRASGGRGLTGRAPVAAS